jgi:hypothetical protein
MEGFIYQIVRQDHYQRGLISVNDLPTKEFIKARLLSGLSDTEIMKYLEWNQIPERATASLEAVKASFQAADLLNQIIQTRSSLTEIITEIKTLAQTPNS